jgi:hypothetical protein
VAAPSQDHGGGASSVSAAAPPVIDTAPRAPSHAAVAVVVRKRKAFRCSDVVECVGCGTWGYAAGAFVDAVYAKARRDASAAPGPAASASASASAVKPRP